VSGRARSAREARESTNSASAAAAQPWVGSPGREHPATNALHSRSVDELTASLRDDLRRHAGFRDSRDVMIHLTPYHDAAGRLGSLPQDVFEVAAVGAPEDVADLARTFGRRTDLTLSVMGWRIEETADGPAYRFAWPF
jgi:hypothetical protein